MNHRSVDVVVIGGGSAGLAAAAAIGARGHTVCIVEREVQLGGILNQCIHNGFGLHHFRQELTGPEYAERFVDIVSATPGVEIMCDAAIVSAEQEGARRRVYAASPRDGVTAIEARAVVLAMGCRERNRGNVGIPGTRPSGIFTAGLAQRLVNIEGYIPGREVVIVGSGDIGLIMARRMTWVGARVHAVVEIQPYPSGLTRNIAQCLNDFSIPLYLSHVVSTIHGRDRVEGVSVAPVVNGRADSTRAFRIDCDTLLLSVGLVPDNEVSDMFGVSMNAETGGARVDARLMTSCPGVFACGNVLHVHDLVDYVTEEATRCGSFVADYVEGAGSEPQHSVVPGGNIKYVLPNRYAPGRDNRFYFRPLIVKNDAELAVTIDGTEIFRKRIVHVQPSEMVSLTLGPAHFRRAGDAPSGALQVALA